MSLAQLACTVSSVTVKCGDLHPPCEGGGRRVAQCVPGTRRRRGPGARHTQRGLGVVAQLQLTEAEHRPARPPRVATRMLEQGVMFEFGALMAASPMLRCMGRGDHHPVLVMPGFLGDDRSTLPLRLHL